MDSFLNFLQGVAIYIVLGYFITLIRYFIKDLKGKRKKGLGKNYSSVEEQLWAEKKDEEIRKQVYKVFGDIISNGFFGMIAIMAIGAIFVWISMKVVN